MTEKVEEGKINKVGEVVGAEAQQTIISGEVHVIATQDGRLSVQGPNNAIIALGLVELAKHYFLKKHDANIQAANLQPRIVKADAGALSNLQKLKNGVH